MRILRITSIFKKLIISPYGGHMQHQEQVINLTEIINWIFLTDYNRLQ